ncbi:hypothetical protein PUNSTDRAFT_109207 [Punctularia strigosozonata HHB-11173 SS5]|uniref:Integral membrane protein n=1 Tax=Punctularia strigosozonata (strain HHB-11173) TaxID=741275 RepID=R7RZR0_PUNST|nr:uncharacterized protein PUNSTDRAFT_109207 [Punctularia strigosozonata HHB-11173 SS5]EIN03600.1 hypothetical protein PUNSTDRAFT_109207 [Punctularia strigosozonata HHB-11173 SS5]
MPRSFYVPILISGMLITGSSNSLWSKWQDMQCVENCNDDDPRKHILYEQPVWQTLQMFAGEMLCFLPVLYAWAAARYRQRRIQLPSEDPIARSVDDEDDASAKPQPAGRALRGWAVLLLWLPAACDLTGTTLMNVGLLYTPVSIYQMTRGALVLFVGTFSVIFLRRRLRAYQWLALLTVMTGVALVGLSGSMVKDALRDEPESLDNNAGGTMLDAVARALIGAEAPTGGDLPPPEKVERPEATKVLIGVFFILFAQIFTATQFVVEEVILSRYAVAPLVAVGYEGLFGALSILLLMPFLALWGPSSPSSPSPSPSTPSTPYEMWFDLPRGWHQLVDTPSVLYSGLAIALSISLFNFFGLSVTRHVSATARSLTDTCRTLTIWIVSLGLGWEKLLFPISLLQVSGFALLVYGTFLFNNLVAFPIKSLRPPPDAPEEAAEETEALLDETATLPADLGQSGFDVLPPHSPDHANHPPSRSGSQRLAGASSGGAEAARPSEERGFDVAGTATGR